MHGKLSRLLSFMLLGNIVEFMITKMKNVRCRGGCHLTSVVWLIIFCFFTAAFAKTPVRFVLVPSFPPFILHFFLFVCVFVERKKEPEEREILERERENALMRLLLLCSHVSKLFLVGTGEFKADIHRTTFSITFSSFNNFCVKFFCGEWWPTPHSLVLHIFLFLSCSLFTFTVKLNNHFHT